MKTPPNCMGHPRPLLAPHHDFYETANSLDSAGVRPHVDKLNCTLPKATIPALVFIAPFAEVLLGLVLVLGWLRHSIAFGCAAILILFALILVGGLSGKRQLNSSVSRPQVGRPLPGTISGLKGQLDKQEAKK